MLFDALEQVLERVQKPARYIGGELNSVVKDPAQVQLRYALCFPDLYEIGMSHLGSKILYSIKNARDEFWCERVFMPARDMESEMRAYGIPLYGLESLEPINTFDMIGFTLQYEMTYTTILAMLDLAGLPVRCSERRDLAPIVMAGGPCACNPEPLADFIDLFVLGEGEEVNLEIMDLLLLAKREGWSKREYLRKAAQIQGVYVPALYRVSYHADGRVQAVVPEDGAPATVKKRIIEDFDKAAFPEECIVPFVDIVHDRSMLEVLRGCLRGCRFCQAGFIYRPFREKEPQTLNRQAQALTDSTGYSEISLTSLSTSDYSQLEPLLDALLGWSNEKQVNLSLPSLRIDAFSPSLLEKVSQVRKSGLTFAPEAGTQRLRDVINKNITEQEVLDSCRMSFEGGYTSVKLYFMLGLPTETLADIEGIAALAQKIVDLYYDMPNRPKGKGVNVTISAACFVPKPFTPFQYEPQDRLEEFYQKQRHLKNAISSRKISYRYHDSPTSVVEAVLARGDRRLGAVVEAVWRSGGSLEGWDENFALERWQRAMEQLGLDAAFYAHRRRGYDEVFPWSHLDYGVSERYLARENEKAHAALTTRNCREQCTACGAAELYAEGGRRLPCR